MDPASNENRSVASALGRSGQSSENIDGVLGGPIDLEDPTLEDTPQPRPVVKRRSNVLVRVLGFGLLAIGLIASIPLTLHTIDMNKVQSRADAQNTNTNLKVQSIPLSSVGQKLGATISPSTSTLTVNGQVSVANTVELEPTSQPANPTAGQLFYSQSLNKLGYYNGSSFVYLQNAGASVTNITNINTPTTNTTNNITNVNGGGVSALHGTTGDLAVFTAADTIADSLINQSGTTVTVGGDTVNVGTTGSTEGVTAGSLSGSSTTTVQGGTGGIVINTGASTGASGNVTIESGGSSTTASGNITIDTGSNYVTGTIVSDFGFEDGTDGIAPWTGATTTVSQDCTVAHSGSCSLAMAGGAFWGVLTDTNDLSYVVPITAGHHYYVTAWVKAATGGTTIGGALIWENSGVFDSSYLAFPTTTTTTSGWTEMIATGVAPAGTTYGVFRFGNTNGGSSNGTQYLDDVVVTDLSSGTASSDLDLGATNAQSVTIGNMNETEETAIDGGSGIEMNAGPANIGIEGGAIAVNGSGASSFGTDSGSLTLSSGGGTDSGTFVTNQQDSTSEFEVQSAEDVSLLNVDSTDSEISLGTGAGSSLGYTGVGPWDGGGIRDSLNAQKETTTTAGTIDSISAYIGTETSPNNLYQFAIYADNGSGTAPGAYIASTAIGTLGSGADAWYTLPITDTTLAANTAYWIVYWQNWPGSGGTDNSFTYSPGGSGTLDVNGDATWQTGPDNGLPATFPAVNSSDTSVASLYASYTSAESALTTNQFGAMTLNGAALFQDPTDSTVAFQIQDSLGNPLLTVDTADEIVEISTLDVSDSLTVDGHIISGGGTPTYTAGAAACTAPTITITGDDTSGTISITTGTSCPAGGTLANVTFADAYTATPHIELTPGSSASLALGAYVNNSAETDDGFSIGTNGTPTSATTYQWNYQVIQ